MFFCCFSNYFCLGLKPLFLRSALVLYWNLPVTCAPSTPWRRRNFVASWNKTVRFQRRTARGLGLAIRSSCGAGSQNGGDDSSTCHFGLAKKSQAVDFERGGWKQKGCRIVEVYFVFFQNWWIDRMIFWIPPFGNNLTTTNLWLKTQATAPASGP